MYHSFEIWFNHFSLFTRELTIPNQKLISFNESLKSNGVNVEQYQHTKPHFLNELLKSQCSRHDQRKVSDSPFQVIQIILNFSRLFYITKIKRVAIIEICFTFNISSWIYTSNVIKYNFLCRSLLITKFIYICMIIF